MSTLKAEFIEALENGTMQELLEVVEKYSFYADFRNAESTKGLINAIMELEKAEHTAESEAVAEAFHKAINTLTDMLYERAEDLPSINPQD